MIKSNFDHELSNMVTLLQRRNLIFPFLYKSITIFSHDHSKCKCYLFIDIRNLDLIF